MKHVIISKAALIENIKKVNDEICRHLNTRVKEKLEKEPSEVDITEIYGMVQYVERKGFELRTMIQEYTIFKENQYSEALKKLNQDSNEHNG